MIKKIIQRANISFLFTSLILLTSCSLHQHTATPRAGSTKSNKCIINPAYVQWKNAGNNKLNFSSNADKNGDLYLNIVSPGGKGKLVGWDFTHSNLPDTELNNVKISLGVNGKEGTGHIWFLVREKNNQKKTTSPIRYCCHYFSLKGDGSIKTIELSRLHCGSGRFNLSKLKSIYITTESDGPVSVKLGEIGFNFANYKPIKLKTVKVKKIFPVVKQKLAEPGLEGINWKRATTIMNLNNNTGLPALEKSRISLAYSNDHMYVRGELQCSDSSKLKATIQKRDGPIWEDDDFEVILDPANTALDRYQFILNSKNYFTDIFFGLHPVAAIRKNQIEWNSKTITTVKKSNNKWIAEMAIPFKEISFNAKTGAVLPAQFARINHTSGENSSWTLTDTFPNASNFGYLYFSDMMTSKLNVSSVKMYINQQTRDICVVFNVSGAEINEKINLAVDLLYSGRKKRQFKSITTNKSTSTVVMSFQNTLVDESHYRITINAKKQGESAGDFFACEAKISIPSDIKYGSTLIWPRPKEYTEKNGTFLPLKSMKIFCNTNANKKTLSVAEYLSDLFYNYLGIRLQIENNNQVMSQALVIGTTRSLQKNIYDSNLKINKKQAYSLEIDKHNIVLKANDFTGLFYAATSLSQVIRSTRLREERTLPLILVTDWPDKDIRFLSQWYDSVWTPEHINFDYNYFTSNYLKPMVAENKLNYFIYRNISGVKFKNRNLEKISRKRPMLSIDEYGAIAKYCRKHFIEFVPSINPVSHCNWLINAHPELKAGKDPWQADTMNPKFYPLIFAILDEFINQCKPKYVEFAEDEWWHYAQTPAQVNGIPLKEIFFNHIMKVYHYLKERDIKMIILSDMLNKNHNGVYPSGKFRQVKRAINTYKILPRLPKDIILEDWTEQLIPGSIAVQKALGFSVLMGTHGVKIVPNTLKKRINGYGLLGYGNMFSQYLYPSESRFTLASFCQIFACADYSWNMNSSHASTKEIIRRYGNNLCAINSMRPNPLASDIVDPIDIRNQVNANHLSASGFKLDGLKPGLQKYGFIPMKLINPPDNSGKSCIIVKNNSSGEINIKRNCSSLIFLHGAYIEKKSVPSFFKRLRNKNQQTHQFRKGQKTFTIAYYKISYEDGTTKRITVDYGLNIANLKPFNIHVKYLYEPRYTLDCLGLNGENKVLYQYEWVNPSPHKKITSIQLESIAPDCAVALLALSARQVNKL